MMLQISHIFGKFLGFEVFLEAVVGFTDYVGHPFNVVFNDVGSAVFAGDF